MISFSIQDLTKRIRQHLRTNTTLTISDTLALIPDLPNNHSFQRLQQIIDSNVIVANRAVVEFDILDRLVVSDNLSSLSCSFAEHKHVLDLLSKYGIIFETLSEMNENTEDYDNSLNMIFDNEDAIEEITAAGCRLDSHFYFISEWSLRIILQFESKNDQIRESALFINTVESIMNSELAQRSNNQILANSESNPRIEINISSLGKQLTIAKQIKFVGATMFVIKDEIKISISIANKHTIIESITKKLAGDYETKRISQSIHYLFFPIFACIGVSTQSAIESFVVKRKNYINTHVEKIYIKDIPIKLGLKTATYKSNPHFDLIEIQSLFVDSIYNSSSQVLIDIDATQELLNQQKSFPKSSDRTFKSLKKQMMAIQKSSIWNIPNADSDN